LNERAELRSEIEIWRDNLGRGGVHRWQIDGVAYRAMHEHVSDLLGDFDTDRLLGLGGRSAQVRRQGDVGQRQKFAVFRERLVLENVQTGSRDMAALEARD
jgi:hypothetical protein